MPALTVRSLGECAIEDLALRPVERRDVLVRIDASGMCHSDTSVYNGDLGGRLPVVLGHEAAGTVVEAGADVTHVRVGDRVVLAAIPACGACWFCARGEPYLCERAGSIWRAAWLDGTTPVRGASGLGTFADAIVVDERVAIPVRTDLPAEQLSLLGCAVLTGAGAVLNIARVRVDDSVAVIGAGGIGLAAVQAARAAGAGPVVAIDPSAAARTAALAQGATHAYASGGEVDAALTGQRGFDAVIECVGVEATFAAAWELTRRGGEIVVVGVGPRTARNPIPLVDAVLAGRRVSGCVYGSSSVHRDIPRYVAMAEDGRLDFAAMLGRTIALADAPAVLRNGPTTAGRTVIVP